MNINEVLNGDFKNFTKDNAVDFFNEMKNRSIFDLSESEIKNVVDFICTVPKKEDSIDYLFYVVDEEIFYPDDDRLKKLFNSDDRMYALRQDMLDILENDYEEETSDEENDDK